ncbi:MAG: SDR family oxidoreductase [Deltaproteobacteria bacterium]|nr:SDR family oxidoreductase [Deltaproteobacteria bacterium]
MKDTELFQLARKTAIVTGGGSGIGRRVAIAMADYGASVVIGDVDGRAADRVAREIEAEGHPATAIEVDVTSPQEVQNMVDRVIGSYGRIDILFNNAGIAIRGPAEAFSLEDWNRVIAVNLTGMFVCAQAVGRVMIRQGGGKIINTASVSGKLGHPGNIAYAAAKHGVIGMSKVMAVEWAEHGVNVNCIGPGVTRTALTARVFADRELYDELVGKVPMGRLGEPEDLVGTVIFLASDASNYITGQTIYVEGGRMID